MTMSDEADETAWSQWGAALSGALAELPQATEDAGLPQVQPVEVSAQPVSGGVELTWWYDSARTLASVAFGRDGTDVDGQGPWSECSTERVVGYTFERLAPGTEYTFWVEATWREGGTDKVEVRAAPRP